MNIAKSTTETTQVLDDTRKPKGTTKSNGKKEKNDKFYTNPEIAELCLSLLNLDDYDIKIEPSAGSGSFSNLVPNCYAYDLEPEGEGIIKQDWLEYSRSRVEDNNILVFGNPPFGVQNNLAVKFINHSAQFADTIAFILPRSFRKESLVNKLNPHLFLREELILPKNSFLLEGSIYNLPAVFQIWDYRKDDTRRELVKDIPKGFKFVKKDENPDFSLQRVGGKAGQATVDWMAKNTQSNNFVILDDKKHLESIIKLLNSHQFENRDDAVGPRSISKNEFIPILNKIITEVE